MLEEVGSQILRVFLHGWKQSVAYLINTSSHFNMAGDIIA